MLPYAHLLIGLIISGSLYFVFPEIDLIKAGILLASSVLIDFDDYLYYLYEKGEWNPLKVYKKMKQENEEHLKSPRKERNNSYLRLCIFHGGEWVILFLVLGVFVSEYFLFVSLGIILHLILDTIDHHRYNDRLERVSVIHDFLKYKKLRKAE